MAERSKAAAATIAHLADGAQATSAEAVLAIEKRGQQLDDWVSMTGALAVRSEEVKPAAKQHQADTDTANRAVQLITERFRANALDAQKIASAASARALISTDMEVTGQEGPR